MLINLFDKRPDHVLVAEYNGQYIGCADNGLLTMIAGGMPEKVIKLPLPPEAPKNTFTILQLLAAVARELSRGKALGELGPLTQQINVKHNLQPLVGDDFIEGQIIHIDSFENVVVNITRQQFDQQRKNRQFRIFFRRDEVISQISETYADVPEGAKLALFNAAGYLEIAINKGNAAGLFGLQGFRRDQLTQNAGFQQLSYYQTVKIIFQ